jgi:hypothetical protein
LSDSYFALQWRYWHLRLRSSCQKQRACALNNSGSASGQSVHRSCHLLAGPANQAPTKLVRYSYRTLPTLREGRKTHRQTKLYAAKSGSYSI